VRFRILFPAFAVASLVGCLGNTGDSQPPPSDVTPVAGDGIAGITWTPQLGISYLAFGATNPNLTTTNWTDLNIAGFAILNNGTNTTPPALVCNAAQGFAANGQPYYFTVDAHTGTAPGGPGSPTMQATPRAAGGLLPNGSNSWKRNPTAIGAAANALAYTTVTTCLPNALPTGVLTAVGPAGAIYSSTDNGNSWTSRTPAGFTANLNAVGSYTAFVNNPLTPGMLIVAVGDGGTSIRSLDGITWTPTATAVTVNGTPVTFRAISVAIANFIAVGDGGQAFASLDGVNWTAQTTNTTANLHAIDCVGATCVAVGDAGVVDLTYDGGITWTVTTLGGGTSALRAVAYGNFDNNLTGTDVNGFPVIGVANNALINTWLVAGDAGSAFQSTTVVSGTATTWTAASVPVSNTTNLVALSYTTQFVAIDNGGNAYTSQTAAAGTWSAAIPSGITDPVALATNGHGYVLAGSSGDDTESF